MNSILYRDDEENKSSNSDSNYIAAKLYRRTKLLAAAIVVVSVVSDERSSFYVQEQQTWERFAAHLIEENSFRRYYRMEQSSFDKLFAWIKDNFTLDEDMSRRRTNSRQPIGLEIVLHCT
jgi:hypothetical protein